MIKKFLYLTILIFFFPLTGIGQSWNEKAGELFFERSNEVKFQISRSEICHAGDTGIDWKGKAYYNGGSPLVKLPDFCTLANPNAAYDVQFVYQDSTSHAYVYETKRSVRLDDSSSWEVEASRHKTSSRAWRWFEVNIKELTMYCTRMPVASDFTVAPITQEMTNYLGNIVTRNCSSAARILGGVIIQPALEYYNVYLERINEPVDIIISREGGPVTLQLSTTDTRSQNRLVLTDGAGNELKWNEKFPMQNVRIHATEYGKWQTNVHLTAELE
ncbi:TPA: hypothetical protein IBX02_000752 [Escherichia coli]|nr:hypothetical protein [Escherichia coli]HAM4833686.1 hypothetical protein [Escherichia coli]